MTTTPDPAKLARLRQLDAEADALRKELGLARRDEILTWFESQSGDRCYEVRADGYGRITLYDYTGHNPIGDVLLHHEAEYDDADAACAAALRLAAYGVDWDARDKDDDPPAANSPRRYLARFEPQAWINDYAVEVDAEGPTTWECTAFVRHTQSNYFHDIDREIERSLFFLDRDDVLKGDPNAPAWVREWQGPFTITVEFLEDA